MTWLDRLREMRQLPENYYASEIGKSRAVMRALNWHEKKIRQKITALSSKQFNRKGPENRFI